MHSRSQVVRVEGSHKGMTGSRRLVMEKAQRVVTGSILMDQKSISTKKKDRSKGEKKLQIFV